MERSLLIIKPGFLKYEKKIKDRIKNLGAKITHEKKMVMDDVTITKHYAEHLQKDFFPELKKYMQSGEVLVMCAEREKDGLIADIRQIVGATKNPEKGTIRHDFGIGKITENVIHASDSVMSAERELNIFFPEMFQNAEKTK